MAKDVVILNNIQMYTKYAEYMTIMLYILHIISNTTRVVQIEGKIS